MQLTQDFLHNRTFTNNPCHFSALAPEHIVPEGVSDPMEARRLARQVETGAIVQPNGDVLLRIHDWNVWRRCIHDFAELLFKLK